MKATIESTNSVVFLGGDSKSRCRVWEGVTEGGVPFTAYIVCCQVKTVADNGEFERDLEESGPPSRVAQCAIDMRLII